MKLNYAIALMACLFICTTVFAQNPMPCGLHDHDILIDRLLLNKKYLKEIGIQQKDGVVSYVPVKYHIIGKSDGSARQSPKKVLDMHCALNNFYADGDDGIQFYIKDGFNYIDNNTAYDNHSSVGGQFQLSNNRVSNAINIFIPKDANTGNQSVGTTLGYYSPGNDWIVIRKADANGSSLTAPHELGHFFSLPHPFNGWDFDPYDSNVHGVTVGNLSPDGVPNEKMDGSNCNTAGDFICDTPPCYLFFPWGNCNYNGGAKDPDGVLVNPDESNIMDYFDDDCAPKYFTADQKAIILADYEGRPALHAPWNPIATSITGPPTVVEPEDDSTTSGYDHVILDWEPVNGADRYLLEIDRLSDFSLNPTIQVVFQSNADIWGIFEADKSYHWRVTPFNPYYTCAASTSINKFTTGTSLSANNVLAVDNLRVEPNPVSQNYVVVSLDSADAFDAEISIVSTTGQTLQVTNQHFHVGHSDIELSIENIPNGMYLLNITSGDKLITKKIIVAK